MTPTERKTPPDQAQRIQALNPDRSVLVQAPAGSGKTDLLTRRFLRLLSEVEDPAQIVAITFTKAAAAEMRHRILAELEKASNHSSTTEADEFAMATLAHRALERSQQLGWNLLELSSQLRISTIDSFCRELAVQQPLLSGLGGGLDIAEQAEELYRRAARNTLDALSKGSIELQRAIETLLRWRDNNWKDVEDQLVEMLAKRDRWMKDFVLASNPDWDALRERLERPFANAVASAISHLARIFAEAPDAHAEALWLARFAHEQSEGKLHGALAELAEFPCPPFNNATAADDARHAYLALADLVLTGGGTFRKTVDVRSGFPTDRKQEKKRFAELIANLSAVAGLEESLNALRTLPPAQYTDEDWIIVRACFVLLRHAAAELRVVFAEAGVVDYAEVSQMAQRVLADSEGHPTDAAIQLADNIHHLLVDEFQDTSRKQHELIASLVAAWGDQSGRTVFVVGDPMQSIYFFRDADAELFPRVQKIGLELPGGAAHEFDFAPLTSNFRTAPELVQQLNEFFAQVFAADDGSGVRFSEAAPARQETGIATRLQLHLEFVPQSRNSASADEKKVLASQRQAAHDTQIKEIVALVQSHAERIHEARQKREKYRIAVLGRTRSTLAPIAAALRTAAIPFRAVDLESLADRPEVLDALALARALKNDEDRVAWLGVLRAPWCGLSLADLHTLTSGDEEPVKRRAIPELLREHASLLSHNGQRAIARLTAALENAPPLSASMTGTWLEQVWLQLGGADCVDATARENLRLLWSSLDALPDGEPDLLGSALGTALKKLTAQPDPAAENDCGVHLMTIHKSKGLEFEIVIVPDLQARGRNTSHRMLAWLERGIAEPDEANSDESGEITEFLVAPQQPKGEDRGLAKQWVDSVYHLREKQEMRRILYVAATRAREELHLFARPEYKDGEAERELIEPASGLLKTAWPAIRVEVQEQLTEWRPSETSAETKSVDDKPTILHRLPADYDPPVFAWSSPQPDVIGLSGQLYERHEGGVLSRALGTAVHALLEEMAHLRTSHDWPAIPPALAGMKNRIAVQVRAAGVESTQAEKLATEALEIALRTADDSIAQWILSPHPEAASEARWAGVLEGKLRTVQADRVFRGGPEPMANGNGVWWIIDYKTAHADVPLEELRKMFAPQLELYARVLRLLHANEITIRAGLYYPRMSKFDWWAL